MFYETDMHSPLHTYTHINTNKNKNNKKKVIETELAVTEFKIAIIKMFKYRCNISPNIKTYKKTMGH